MNIVQFPPYNRTTHTHARTNQNDFLLCSPELPIHNISLYRYPPRRSRNKRSTWFTSHGSKFCLLACHLLWQPIDILSMLSDLDNNGGGEEVGWWLDGWLAGLVGSWLSHGVKCPCVVCSKTLFCHGRGLGDEMPFWVKTVNMSRTIA